MRTDELIKALNEEAARLKLKPVTRRMLRDWVDEDLIGARKARGRGHGRHPIWQFAEIDVRRAKRIVELKTAGVTRISEIRIYLWFAEDNYPIVMIGDALRSEFTRLMNRERRKLRFKYDHRYHKSLTDADVQKHSNQLPPIDAGLAEVGFKIGPAVAIKIISELLWGKAGHEELPHLMTEEASRILGRPIGTTDIKIDFGDLSGVFGAADEILNSGEADLKHVKDADLYEARRRLRDLISALSFGGDGLHPQLINAGSQFRRAIAAFERTEWLVSSLTAFAVQTFRKRTGAHGNSSEA